ncbi:hypothetical protein WCD74_04735 [Actinomycetospora sp. OC33-EN08]|uniref:RCK N-terminal domain-containing protein n=1 Tax=Actinomycetospora aurantiaca TaxID=3129233 RepID=A0ABU8MJE5_9PSEU
MRFSLRPGRHAQPSVGAPMPVATTPDPRLVDDAPATVEVVASRATARLLADAVPAGWHVMAGERPSHRPGIDFVVLVDPDPDLASDALERGGAEVVVLLGRHAPTARLVALLDAGVSICLRESPARLVAGHMVARRRRGHPPTR